MQIDGKQLERLLAAVRKPGRYVGGEYNSVVKDWEGTPTRVCLAFPDIYDLGMCNLGMAILYEMLNARADVLAERAFLPWVDMIEAMRQAEMPLYSLESKRPLADFDVIGLSIPYEQVYTNVLEMLDLAGLPVLSVERDERFPLVIAGGHSTFNPEPMADFVDAFVIGDGEEAIFEVLAAFEGARRDTREGQLLALARIPGVYVPSFYDVSYHSDGRVSEVSRRVPEVALPVMKRVVPVLPPPPTHLIVPNIDVSHNRATIEIQRGCTRGCRFCHAGVVTRPVRERPAGEILDAIERIVAETGFDEIGLLSLSSSDYSDISQLVESIAERFSRRFPRRHLSVSLPALRADSFSVELADAMSNGRHSGFTFAPEAATEELRGVINKPIATEQMLEVAREVFERGWRTIKLYFMIGLPAERMEDVEAIADLADEVRRIGRQAHGRKAQVNVSVNTFIPKPHTPLQWISSASPEEVREKQVYLARHLRGKGLKLSYSDDDLTLLESVLSRGDRRLGRVIHRAWQLGARFDAWYEQRDLAAWMQAFDEAGIDPDFYVRRERAEDEVFPWDVVSTGIRKGYLLAEYRRSRTGELRADCRGGCYGCGVLAAYGDEWSEGWCCPEPAARSAQ